MFGRKTTLSIALAAVAGVAGALLLIPAAGAASGPTFTVDIAYDGTGQGTPAGCPITGAGGDNTAHDGVVCTNDDIAYAWNYAIPDSTATAVTFTQTVPAGLTWAQNDLLLCAGNSTTGYSGSGTITNGGRTLTCALTWPSAPSRSGSIPMVAHVDTSVGDGTVVHSDLDVDAGSVQTLPAPPVTVRAQPRVDLRKWLRGHYFDSHGNLVIKVDVAGIQATNQSGKGISSLAGPITFTDDLSGMPAGTTLLDPSSCYDTPDATDPQVHSGAQGAWACTQSGPGKAVDVTVTGADTSGIGSPTTSGGVTVLAGSFWLVVPRASLVTGDNVLADQLENFDPSDGAGASNYGSGYEPGGAPGDTCANPSPNNNCAQVTVPITKGTDSFTKSIVAAGKDPALPTDPASHLPLVGPGGRFDDRIDYSSAVDETNVVVCDFWDPAQQHVDPSTAISTAFLGAGAGQPSGVSVEWTTRAFAGDAARAAAGCGTAGDPTTDGPWQTTAPSDPAQITGFRVILPQYHTNDGAWELTARFTDVDATSGDQVTDAAAASSTQRTSAAHTSATYEVTSSVLGGAKDAFDASGARIDSALAGESVRFRLTPTFGPTSAPAQVLTVVDTLPPCEVSPTLDASAATDWTMTVTAPADTGPDGVVCTADDVRGAKLTFTSNSPVTPGAVPPINYHVIIAADAADGTSALNSAVVSAPGNQQAAGERSFVGYLTIRSAAEVNLFKTADAPTVQVAPDPIGYTLTWSNTEARDVGRTQWIDVLPHAGDGRGSAFSGAVALASTDLHGATAGVTIEYTDASAASLASDPSDASNQASGATTWCASFGGSGCPASVADVTAIRITIADLKSGDVGALHMVEQPTGNVEGDVYANNVGPGRAAALSLAVPVSNTVRVDVVASSIGRRVWLDANRDGVQDPGETGLVGVTLHYTGTVGSASVSGSVVTGADGVYALPNLHSGTYRVVVDAATLPAGLEPTYDLDNGTVTPDGDSGDVALGYDTDRTDVNFGYAQRVVLPPSSSSSSTPPLASSTPPPASSTPPTSSSPPPSASSTPPSSSAGVLPTSSTSPASSSAGVLPTSTTKGGGSSSGGTLAATGWDVLAPLAIAIALIAGGTLLLAVAAGRRRRHG